MKTTAICPGKPRAARVLRRRLLISALLAAGLAFAVVAPSEAQWGTIALQVGAFGKWENAVSLRDRVAATDPNAYIDETVVRGRRLYRVRVGAFPSRGEAEAAGQRLRDAGFEVMIVVGENFVGRLG